MSEARQMRASFLVTLPRPPHHRLRRSFPPGRSLLVRRFQAGSQSESNSTGDKGELLQEACLRKPSPSNRGAEQRPRLWRNRAVRRLNEATSFASESAAKRLCRIVDKVLSEARQMRASFLVTLPRPPHHRLRRSFSPGRSLLVRPSQTKHQNKLSGRQRRALSASVCNRIAWLCRAGGENPRRSYAPREDFHSLRIFRPCFAETQENPQKYPLKDRKADF